MNHLHNLGQFKIMSFRNDNNLNKATKECQQLVTRQIETAVNPVIRKIAFKVEFARHVRTLLV